MQRYIYQMPQAPGSQLLMSSYNRLDFMLEDINVAYKMIITGDTLAVNDKTEMVARLGNLWHGMYKESLRMFLQEFDTAYGRQGGNADHLIKKDALKHYYDAFEQYFRR